MNNLFTGLISSKTRISLLFRFFKRGTKAHLRQLAKDLQVSSNAVREELNQLTKSNLFTSERDGHNVYYRANSELPHFLELRSMVGKIIGLDQVMVSISMRLGNLETACIIDDYADGRDTSIIDLVLGVISTITISANWPENTERYIKRKFTPWSLPVRNWKVSSPHSRAGCIF